MGWQNVIPSLYFASHKSGKRSVLNYPMVVGLKDTVTDKTKMPFQFILVQTEISWVNNALKTKPFLD